MDVRMLFKAVIPTAAGKPDLKDGSLTNKPNYILKETKPEAIYFFGRSLAHMFDVVLGMEDSSHLTVTIEPWFLLMDVQVTVVPVLYGEDFQKAGPSLEVPIKI